MCNLIELHIHQRNQERHVPRAIDRSVLRSDDFDQTVRYLMKPVCHATFAYSTLASLKPRNFAAASQTRHHCRYLMQKATANFASEVSVLLPAEASSVSLFDSSLFLHCHGEVMRPYNVTT